MATRKTRHLTHVRSRRFLLAAAATRALLKLLSRGWVAVMAAVAATGAPLALLLAGSIRLSDLTLQVSGLAREMTRISARRERGAKQIGEEASPDRLMRAMFTLEETISVG